MAGNDRAFLVASVVGSGLAAKTADAAGADYLLALNARRLQEQGISSLASFLPLRAANDWVLDFAKRDILGRCNAPVHVGLSVSDPGLSIADLVTQVRDLGFAGVCNFPSASSIDGRLGRLLDREGLGFEREIALVEEAGKAGLSSFTYVRDRLQARQMADAGADVICMNLEGGDGGITADHLALEHLAGQIEQVLQDVPDSIAKFCHCGSGNALDEAQILAKALGVDGFVSGPPLDRPAVAPSLDDVTQSFPGSPRLTRIKTDMETGPARLIGTSPTMVEIRETLQDLAFAGIPVLFRGETGTGKSLAAHCLHDASRRDHRKPVVVDCAALDQTFFGVPLFGLANKTPDGAVGERSTLERAAGRSVIFEDVGALTHDQQGKIMGFIETKTLPRVGDPNLRRANARVISTSREDLRLASSQGRFRPELYYRLAGDEVVLPPLRDRLDDIPELVRQMGRLVKKGEAAEFTNDALRCLMSHSWPGNLRELAHVVTGALRRTRGLKVDVQSLGKFGQEQEQKSSRPAAAETPKEPQSEKDWITSALARNGFKRAQTAEALGMTTRTLYNKIKKLKIEV